MAHQIVVMGVCGSGKSAVAQALAAALGASAVDADDLHSPQAVDKMRSGQALDEQDREPWLDRVGAVLAQGAAEGFDVVMACSALRRVYRDRLRRACPGLRFVFLDGSRALIAERLGRRRGHYMPASLLDSQLQLLERPSSEETDVLRVGIDQALHAVVEQSRAALGVPVFRVAVVGVGIMGQSIARRLLACGHRVALFDLDASKLEPLVLLGAHAASSAAQAARGADFVITSLNSAHIVRSAVFGPGGICEGLGAAALVIDMSSIDPPSTRQLCEELRQRCGAGWVDAPLSGGAPKAALGRLTVMAGGSDADVTRARALMKDLCANFTHMGPSGAGQTTKLVNQLLCAIGFQAVAEAVRLAESGGVDAARLAQALQGGRADSQILAEFGPKMAARDFTPTGRIDNMLKDLEAVQAFSQSQRLPLPLTAHIAELHRAFVAAGVGAEDTVAMMKQFNGFAADSQT
jgi:2-hydroxy-3-oxopropionate reductase